MKKRFDVSLPEVSQSETIPKIIHQNFLPGWDALPAGFRDLTGALQDRNPGWDYRFQDAASGEAFIDEVFGPEMLRAYRSIDPVYYAARSDLLRYLRLYAEGGVYFDMKSTAARPLDDVLRPDDRYILSHWPREPGRIGHGWSSSRWALRHFPRGEYMQWFIVASRGHPYLWAVIEAVLDRIANYSVIRDQVGHIGVLQTTGPIAYTLAIEKIRTAHPHRIVEAERDLGFLYIVTDTPKLAPHGFGGAAHYGRQAAPVVQGGALRRALTVQAVSALRRAKDIVRPYVRPARDRS